MRAFTEIYMYLRKAIIYFDDRQEFLLQDIPN